MKFFVALLNRFIAASFIQIILGISLAREKRLCAELLWREYRDQKARATWIQTGKPHTLQKLKQNILLDISNTDRMKEIVMKHGWPGLSMVGPTGSRAAWLLVQHSDHDSTFQKQCLSLLAKAVEKNEAPASFLAYLTDRVCMHEGQKQIYGTQLHASLKPLPIEDEAHVDERRAKAGLEPLAEYLDHIKQFMSTQPKVEDNVTEMKQLLSKLPTSPIYDSYVAQIKHHPDTMDAL